MDQTKTGRFISEKRKEHGFTQLQLAEKLGVSDRAVSKWETGKSLPDASIMLQLCGLLGITVNDLLEGEVVSVNFSETAEKNLLEMVKQKEAADRRLLSCEIMTGILSVLFLLVTVTAAALVPRVWLRILFITAGFAVFTAGCLCALRIEQTAGYYECGKCGHRYVPSYRSVVMAMHTGRTRYMKCPECGAKSWQKKVTGEKRP